MLKKDYYKILSKADKFPISLEEMCNKIKNEKSTYLVVLYSIENLNYYLDCIDGENVYLRTLFTYKNYQMDFMHVFWQAIAEHKIRNDIKKVFIELPYLEADKLDNEDTESRLQIFDIYSYYTNIEIYFYESNKTLLDHSGDI